MILKTDFQVNYLKQFSFDKIIVWTWQKTKVAKERIIFLIFQNSINSGHLQNDCIIIRIIALKKACKNIIYSIISLSYCFIPLLGIVFVLLIANPILYLADIDFFLLANHFRNWKYKTTINSLNVFYEKI